jgi:hypothetical protein
LHFKDVEKKKKKIRRKKEITKIKAEINEINNTKDQGNEVTF